jgi:hypothetical protein
MLSLTIAQKKRSIYCFVLTDSDIFAADRFVVYWPFDCMWLFYCLLQVTRD